MTNFLFGDIKALCNKVKPSVEWRLRTREITSLSRQCLFRKLAMKACSFFATFSLAIFMANALTTEEHVRTMFRPEHRVHLPEPGMLNLQEDDSSALVSKLSTQQGDESTKCLALCEPKCDKLNVPYYLQVMSAFC